MPMRWFSVIRLTDGSPRVEVGIKSMQYLDKRAPVLHTDLDASDVGLNVDQKVTLLCLHFLS